LPQGCPQEALRGPLVRLAAQEGAEALKVARPPPQAPLHLVAAWACRDPVGSVGACRAAPAEAEELSVGWSS